ncbi:MAG: DUF4258 domain-containing protein [Bacteroidota bacterium]
MNPSIRKSLPYLLLIALAVLLFIVKKCKSNEPQPKPKTTVTDNRDPSANVNRDRGFDRRISYLQYSNHAKCRMECRHITQAEVEEIMRDGNINYKKSDLKNARCPRYAVEGITKDKQDVRIVFAQCNESTTVVTVIDLDTEWTCDCPGDDPK